MGWIKLTGKTLELTGQLVQTASFEDWAVGKGEDIVKQIGMQTGGFILGFGRTTRAKNAIWSDLAKQFAEHEALKVALQNSISDFPSVLGVLSDQRAALPHRADDDVFALPIFTVRHCANLMLQRQLGQSEQLMQLKGGKVFVQWFLEELADQVDTEFSAVAEKSTPTDPYHLNRKTIIGLDHHHDWGKEERGHY